MFEPPEALLIHTLSKLHYLIYELYLINHLSFLKLLNCGTHCHPLLSLNPTKCHLLNLTSTNLILSPFLLKLSLIFSVFPLSGLCYRPYGLSPTLLTKKKEKKTSAKLSLDILINYSLQGHRNWRGWEAIPPLFHKIVYFSIFT